MKAMADTIETVPYLTHFDYVRSIRELTEFVDFTVLNIAENIETSGILQYYKKGTSLEKLLAAAHKARVNELGKAAALQYERFLEAENSKKGKPNEDFTSTVRRHYKNASLLSSLRPMMLFLQVDVSKLNQSSHAPFLNDLAKVCTKHKIDGIVLK